MSGKWTNSRNSGRRAIARVQACTTVANVGCRTAARETTSTQLATISDVQSGGAFAAASTKSSRAARRAWFASLRARRPGQEPLLDALVLLDALGDEQLPLASVHDQAGAA